MIGFDTKDGAILAALGRKEHNIRSLAKATGISRMTTAYRLKRMEQYRLIEEKPSKGKQKVWSLSTASKQTKRKVQVYYGRDMINAQLQFFLRVPKKTVMYTIEGYEYARQMNKTVNKSLENIDIKVHTRYRKLGITIKALCHPKMIGVFPKERASLAIRQRPTIIAKQIPQKSLLGPCLYAFLPSAMCMSNSEKKYTVIFTDESMARVLYDMIGMMHETAEHSYAASRLDVGEFVKHLKDRIHPEPD